MRLTGSGGHLVTTVGAPLLRLLAEESGLRAGLSKALARSGFVPGHDRGQVLVDVAVALGLGATSVAGAVQLLSGCAAVLGAVASPATAWRAFDELDEAALGRCAAARAAHRRRVWAVLAKRPEGFPWVQVAGHAWQGWVVLDVDASLVECHSDKEGAAPTYKSTSSLDFRSFGWRVGGV